MSQGLCEARGFAFLRSARRVDPDAGVDLRKRRAWYTDPPPEELPLGEGDEVPDWVKDPAKALAEIKRVRKEAAEHRTKRNEAEQKVAKLEKPADPNVAGNAPAKPATKPDDKKSDEKEESVAKLQQRLDELQNNLQSERMANLRVKVATEAGLSVALANRLQGTTEAELKTDAEALKGLMPAPPTPEELRRMRQTTDVPGGNPANETDAQRRARIFGR